MKTATQRKLERELTQAQLKVGKYISRPGIHYGWFNAGAFDAEIDSKRRFAVRWREQVLALVSEGGALTSKPCRLASRYGDPAPRTYIVYSVDGVEKLAVCSSLGSNTGWSRVAELKDGQTFAEYVRVEKPSYWILR
jgi:hypothetical protein